MFKPSIGFVAEGLVRMDIGGELGGTSAPDASSLSTCGVEL